MKDLLISISHHANPDRLQYLLRVLKTFSEYPISHDVVIDTNAVGLDVRGENLTVVSHPSLAHDFHLCWQHRVHFRDRLDDYRWFLYCENDIAVPFSHFDHYRTRFFLLWSDYVPGFVRFEKHDGEEWAVDQTERQPCVCVRSYHCALNQPYHGFWCLPQDALRDTMRPDFVRLSDSREAAASYPMADLNKTALVEVKDHRVSPLCCVHHLPNTYAPCETSPHAKIKVADIFL